MTYIARRHWVIWGAAIAAVLGAPGVLAQEVDTFVICRNLVDGRPEGAADNFAAADKLYGHIRFRAPSPETRISFEWRRNGSVVYGDEMALSPNTTSVTLSLNMAPAGGFTAAGYELVIIQAGRTIAREAFTVGDAAPTRPPAVRRPATPAAGADEQIDSDPDVSFGPATRSDDGAGPAASEEIDDDPEVYFGAPRAGSAGRDAGPQPSVPLGTTRDSGANPGGPSIKPPVPTIFGTPEGGAGVPEGGAGELRVDGLTVALADPLSDEGEAAARSAFPAGTELLYLRAEADDTWRGGVILATWHCGDEVIDKQVIDVEAGGSVILSLFSRTADSLKTGRWRLTLKAGKTELGALPFTIGP